ncbi:DUF664 domain-containing protein [Kitasatospora sp. CMC57]|uniref:DUF664 domain-containing protein n=1 Tax=Kitasatospora sp. CMC57 TaxID=3231513 RepID=A0AB33K0V5_9ACTN
MNSAALLVDAFGRVREVVHGAVAGLGPDELAARLDPKANSIAWLVWHLTRIQDDHVADVAGTEQLWTAQGWHDRFDLPFPATATGYGHTTHEVAAVQVSSARLLTDYYDAVHEHTLSYVRRLSGPALDRIVDESWTPPVTLGVRLVSVVSDSLQHAGQAAFIRGVLRRR